MKWKRPSWSVSRPKANKSEIKRAVETIFDKKVVSVNTLNVRGKNKRERRADFGRTASWKKVQEKKHDISFTAFGRFLEMYPRFWEHFHSFNAYDTAFLQDGSINPQRKLKAQTNNLESFAIPEMDQLIEQYRASEDKQEMIELAHRMAELHHNYASFIPGFYQGFFRVGYWRWLHYPEDFSSKHASGPGELFVEWIDATEKQQTLDAKKTNQKFESSITIYDQWAE